MNTVIGSPGPRPLIDRVVLFDRAADGYRHYAVGAAFGKVVISVP